LNKADLFGYRDCGKKMFRFFKDSEFRIISTVHIYLYFREEETGSGKNSSIEDLFYYSVTLDSDLLLLTRDNLRESYRENEKFTDLLDTSIKDDLDLSTFDKSHKKYRVVRLYEESLK
jgi:hypothetical protein